MGVDMTMNEKDKQAEPVYAYRRRGLDEFCTCDESRYTELSAKPSLFEVAVFYRHPAQPVQPAACQYCNGTGDVHGIDGEWRGQCSECKPAGYIDTERLEVSGMTWAVREKSREIHQPFYLQPPAAAINEHLLEALKLVLPLAKGYAAKNDVGGNQEYCVMAEAAIAAAEAEKAKGSNHD